MPTPGSGAISMDNMRTEITRGTGAISMSELRTRYGGSGAISFNDLRNCEGWIQTNGSYVAKFVSQNGWGGLVANGSITPNEGGTSPNAQGSLIFTTASPGSRMVTCVSTISVNASCTQIQMANNSGTVANVIASPYRGIDVTRVVLANVSRTLTGSTNNYVYCAYATANTGTTHNLIKF